MSVLKIKRGPGKPSDGILQEGELGCDIDSNTLYIGKDVNGTLKSEAIPGGGSGDYISSSDLADALADLLLKAHPVGSIYMSTTNTNPSSFLGGTWVAWGNGRVPVGVYSQDSRFSTPESSGGEYTTPYTPRGSVSGTVGNTTLTESHIPSHNHTFTPDGTISTATLTGQVNNATVQSKTTCLSASGIASLKSARGETVAYGGSGTKDGSASYSDGFNLDASHSHTFTGTQSNTGNTGGGQAHNHTFSGSFSGNATNISTLQPYITCFMWKRTA